MTAPSRLRRTLLRLLVGAVLGLVVGGMLVPYAVIEESLRRFAFVRQVADFADTVAPGLELIHLLSFAALGFAAHFGWRGGRAWQLAAGCALLAALVEGVQVWIPGREAAPVHALLDVVGGVAGFGWAWLVTYAWGTASLPEDAPSSTPWAHGNSEQ